MARARHLPGEEPHEVARVGRRCECFKVNACQQHDTPFRVMRTARSMPARICGSMTHRPTTATPRPACTSSSVAAVSAITRLPGMLPAAATISRTTPLARSDASTNNGSSPRSAGSANDRAASRCPGTAKTTSSRTSGESLKTHRDRRRRSDGHGRRPRCPESGAAGCRVAWRRRGRGEPDLLRRAAGARGGRTACARYPRRRPRWYRPRPARTDAEAPPHQGGAGDDDVSQPAGRRDERHGQEGPRDVDRSIRRPLVEDGVYADLAFDEVAPSGEGVQSERAGHLLRIVSKVLAPGCALAGSRPDGSAIESGLTRASPRE